MAKFMIVIVLCIVLYAYVECTRLSVVLSAEEEDPDALASNGLSNSEAERPLEENGPGNSYADPSSRHLDGVDSGLVETKKAGSRPTEIVSKKELKLIIRKMNKALKRSGMKTGEVICKIYDLFKDFGLGLTLGGTYMSPKGLQISLKASDECAIYDALMGEDENSVDGTIQGHLFTVPGKEVRRVAKEILENKNTHIEVSFGKKTMKFPISKQAFLATIGKDTLDQLGIEVELLAKAVDGKIGWVDYLYHSINDPEIQINTANHLSTQEGFAAMDAETYASIYSLTKKLYLMINEKSYYNSLMALKRGDSLKGFGLALLMNIPRPKLMKLLPEMQELYRKVAGGLYKQLSKGLEGKGDAKAEDSAVRKIDVQREIDRLVSQIKQLVRQEELSGRSSLVDYVTTGHGRDQDQKKVGGCYCLEQKEPLN